MEKVINMIKQNKVVAVMMLIMVIVLGFKVIHKEKTLLNAVHASKETVWITVDTTGRGITEDRPVTSVYVAGKDKFTSYYVWNDYHSKKNLTLLQASKMSDHELVDYAKKHPQYFMKPTNSSEIEAATTTVRSDIIGHVFGNDNETTKERIFGKKIVGYNENGKQVEGVINPIEFNDLVGNKKIGNSYYSGYENNNTYSNALLTKVKNSKVKYKFDMPKSKFVERYN